jgi:hypothetical protein
MDVQEFANTNAKAQREAAWIRSNAEEETEILSWIAAHSIE